MIVCNFYSAYLRISEALTLYMLLSAMDKDGVGDDSFATVRVHVSWSFFSDYPTGASLIRVSTLFVFLALFSRAGAGGFFVCTEFLSRKRLADELANGGEKIVAIVARSAQKSL